METLDQQYQVVIQRSGKGEKGGCSNCDTNWLLRAKTVCSLAIKPQHPWSRPSKQHEGHQAANMCEGKARQRSLCPLCGTLPGKGTAELGPPHTDGWSDLAIGWIAVSRKA